MRKAKVAIADMTQVRRVRGEFPLWWQQVHPKGVKDRFNHLEDIILNRGGLMDTDKSHPIYRKIQDRLSNEKYLRHFTHPEFECVQAEWNKLNPHDADSYSLWVFICLLMTDALMVYTGICRTSRWINGELLHPYVDAGDGKLELPNGHIEGSDIYDTIMLFLRRLPKEIKILSDMAEKVEGKVSFHATYLRHAWGLGAAQRGELEDEPDVISPHDHMSFEVETFNPTQALLLMYNCSLPLARMSFIRNTIKGSDALERMFELHSVFTVNDVSHVKLQPLSQPRKFMLTLKIPAKLLGRDEAVKFYQAYITAYKMDHVAPTLSDHVDKNSQSMMNAALQSPPLEHKASQDTTLPRVRGDAEEGYFHYPLKLPDALSTRVLTKGQVLTQEFMARLESTKFHSGVMQVVAEKPNGDVVVVSPFLRGSFTKITRRQWLQVSRHGGGIIADSTGTGKTLASITRCLTGGTNVIIVPDNLIHHWASEITKHTNLRMWEDPRYLDMQKHSPEKRRRMPKVNLGDYDVVVLHRTRDVNTFQKWSVEEQPRIIIASHSVIRSSSTKKYIVDRLRFTRILVDEAHSTGENTCNKIGELQREFTWLITATPYANYTALNKLLRISHMMELLNLHTSSELEYFKYRHLTIRNKLDRSRLEVETIVEFCDMTENESTFFEQVRNVLLERMVSKDWTLCNVNRLVRLLERLGAGGYMHRHVMLNVIKRCFKSTCDTVRRKQRRDEEEAVGDFSANQARDTAMCMSNEDCAVCACPFTEAVQLSCRHVYCKDCLLGMLGMKMNQCAHCRRPMKKPYYKPHWPHDDPAIKAQRLREEEEAEEEAKKQAAKAQQQQQQQLANVKRPVDDRNELELEAVQLQQAARELAQCQNIKGEDYRNILRGIKINLAEVMNVEELIDLGGKRIRMEQRLDEFIANKQPGQQLVIFMKEQLAADGYAGVITNKGLTVLCAGVMGCRKLESVANIEKFRQGQSDVLLVSNSYSDGFDLFMAKEIWLLNTDLSASKMEQSQGRIIRVAQKYDKVVVRVFLYEDTFDHFLWEYRKQISGAMSKTYMSLYYYFMARKIPGHSVKLFHDLMLRWFNGQVPEITPKVCGTKVVFRFKDLQYYVLEERFYHKRRATGVYQRLRSIYPYDTYATIVNGLCR